MVVHDNIRLHARVLEIHRPRILLASFQAFQHSHTHPNIGCALYRLAGCADPDGYPSMYTGPRFLGPLAQRLEMPPL